MHRLISHHPFKAAKKQRPSKFTQEIHRRSFIRSQSETETGIKSVNMKSKLSELELSTKIDEKVIE